MHRSHHSGHRPSAERKRKAKTATPTPPPAPQKTLHDPRFGAIPMIPVVFTDETGRERHFFDYDPDYAPPMPRGAVRGNVRSQDFCRICHVPRYFYVDVPKTCIECWSTFVFGAREQKHWYETLKFHFDSVAVRCPACRKKRRSREVLRTRLAEAKARANAQPNDPAALLAVAEAIVRYFQSYGEGPLDEAIAASRKARRLLSKHPGHAREAPFWEATCHALAGRDEHARRAYGDFVGAGPRGRREAGLLEEAERWLSAHPG